MPPMLSSLMAKFENNDGMQNVSAEDIQKYMENVRKAFHKKADARVRKLNRVVKNLEELDRLYNKARNIKVNNKTDADKIRDVENQMWTRAKKTVRTMRKVKEQDDDLLRRFEVDNMSLSKTIREFGHIKEQNLAFEELVGEKKKARSSGKGVSKKDEDDLADLPEGDGDSQYEDVEEDVDE